MKQLLGLLGTLAVILAIFYSVGYLQNKNTKQNSFSQKFEYKDTKRVAELKDEVETLRVKALRLQAALDSCKYNITAVPEVTTSKVTYKPKKKSKALEDCTNELVAVKAQLGECIGVKAQIEVEKDLEINKLKRQMDTCAYFVQEMDKALLRMSNDVTKLTNEKDSLQVVLETPIEYVSERPCFKTKRGAKIQAHAFPHEQTIIVNMVPFEKKEFKDAKKSCKRTTR